MLSLSTQARLPILIGMAILLLAPYAFAADAQQLYGIHWWGWSGSQPVDQTPKSLFDLPTHSVWDTEVVLTNSDFWWSAGWFAPLYQTLYPWNVSMITRVDYVWGQCVPSPTNPDYAGYPARFVSTAVNQLYNWAHIWILGNEPNLIPEGNGWPDNKITPAGYAAIYRNVRNAVHSTANVGPPGQHLVLIAGPSPGGVIEGVRWMDGNEWLGQVLDNLSPSEVDGFAIHAYGWDAQDFRDGYRDQLRVIDQKGFGSKPIWITEFNRYTTDDNDEQYSAQFVRDVFSDVNTWNQTSGTHNIVGMTWFIYDSDNQAGGGWNGYAVEYWKTHGFPYGDSRDLYTAFEQTVNQRYPAGIWGSTVANPWIDDFNDGVVDQTAPDPKWILSTQNGGAIQETGGYLKLTGTSGQPSYAMARSGDFLVYDNFVISTKVYLADSTATTSDESNAEIRFRCDNVGIGYGLSFKALDSPNVINLRRSDTWEVIQGKEISYSLPSGTTLYVRIECNGTRIKIKVGTKAGYGDVANWDITDTTFTAKGAFWLGLYHMKDARFDYLAYSPLATTSTGVTGFVRDAYENPVSGVVVNTPGSEFYTTTNPDGSYSMTSMSPGVYDITASKTGYRSQTQQVNVVADTVIPLDFTLTDGTRPTTPIITDDGAYQTTNSSFTFSYSSSDPQSGIVGYQTAVSSSTSPNNIIPGGEWQSVGLETTHTRSGLSLANGQLYYALVRSTNGVGLNSFVGASDGIAIAKAVSSIAKAKAEADTVMVALDDKTVTAKFSDCIYIEDTDKTGGIKVATTGYDEGALLHLAGFLSLANGERQLSAYSVAAPDTDTVPDPLGMINKALGGGALNSYTPGITGGVGTNNIGLLVRTWGKVLESGTGYFIISDGSTTGLKVTVPTDVSPPGTNQYAIVTGISSVESNGGVVTRLLRARKQADIVPYTW